MKLHKWHKQQKIILIAIIGIVVVATVFLFIYKKPNVFKPKAAGEAVALALPPIPNKTVGDEFTASINLNTNSNSVCAVQSDLTFSPSLINVVAINISPSDINGNPTDPAKPFVASFPRESFDNSQGVVHTSLGVPGCTSLDSVLVYSVTFKATGAGNSTLNLANTKVMAGTAESQSEISADNGSISFNIATVTSGTTTPGDTTSNNDNSNTNNSSSSSSSSKTTSQKKTSTTANNSNATSNSAVPSVLTPVTSNQIAYIPSNIAPQTPPIAIKTSPELFANMSMKPWTLWFLYAIIPAFLAGGLVYYFLKRKKTKRPPLA